MKKSPGYYFHTLAVILGLIGLMPILYEEKLAIRIFACVILLLIIASFIFLDKLSGLAALGKHLTVDKLRDGVRFRILKHKMIYAQEVYVEGSSPVKSTAHLLMVEKLIEKDTEEDDGSDQFYFLKVTDDELKNPELFKSSDSDMEKMTFTYSGGKVYKID